MNRLHTMDRGIRNLSDPALRMLGPACTVKLYPGDNLMVHKALDIARRGRRHRGIGPHGRPRDPVCAKGSTRGLAGFVVDGMIRDLPGVQRLDHSPVFARGVTPVGPLHRGPGEINYPVSVGAIVVQAGRHHDR